MGKMIHFSPQRPSKVLPTLIDTRVTMCISRIPGLSPNIYWPGLNVRDSGIESHTCNPHSGLGTDKPDY